MRITDLLDIRSIALDAAPKSKQETLDAAVALSLIHILSSCSHYWFRFRYCSCFCSPS